MRTHNKYGVLLAGINGHKIYCKGESLLIVARYKTLEVKKEHEQVVLDYVNIKYQPTSMHQVIRDKFLNLVEGLI